jgi:hypothetical protein
MKRDEEQWRKCFKTCEVERPSLRFDLKQEKSENGFRLYRVKFNDFNSTNM